MYELEKILRNPILRTGLKAVAPEVALGVNLIMAIRGTVLERDPSIADLLQVIDRNLAETLEILATTESAHVRKEHEIRAHTLLDILNEWSKID